MHHSLRRHTSRASEMYRIESDARFDSFDEHYDIEPTTFRQPPPRPQKPKRRKRGCMEYLAVFLMVTVVILALAYTVAIVIFHTSVFPDYKKNDFLRDHSKYGSADNKTKAAMEEPSRVRRHAIRWETLTETVERLEAEEMGRYEQLAGVGRSDFAHTLHALTSNASALNGSTFQDPAI